MRRTCQSARRFAHTPGVLLIVGALGAAGCNGGEIAAPHPPSAFVSTNRATPSSGGSATLASDIEMLRAVVANPALQSRATFATSWNNESSAQDVLTWLIGVQADLAHASKASATRRATAGNASPADGSGGACDVVCYVEVVAQLAVTDLPPNPRNVGFYGRTLCSGYPPYSSAGGEMKEKLVGGGGVTFSNDLYYDAGWEAYANGEDETTISGAAQWAYLNVIGSCTSSYTPWDSQYNYAQASRQV